MAVNKVVVGGETKIDLSADTVTPADLRAGVKAHDSSGAQITGSIATYAGSTSVTPGTSAQTLQTAGKYLSADIIVAAAQASGKQVATGTFTPTNNNLRRYPVSVTGLGFKPAIVVLYVKEAGGALNSNYEYVLFSVSGFWTALAQNKTTLAWVYGNKENSILHITLESGGFSLSTTDNTYGVFISPYNYIAIGA